MADTRVRLGACDKCKATDCFVFVFDCDCRDKPDVLELCQPCINNNTEFQAGECYSCNAELVYIYKWECGTCCDRFQCCHRCFVADFQAYTQAVKRALEK